MSEPQGNLEKALAQNGSPDPERSRQVQRSAVARFDASMRRVARILFIYLCLFAWLLVFAYCHFLQVSDTKSLLFYGCLMLGLLGSTIMIKMWYSLMTTKIDLLKELKLLRLEVPRGDAPLSEQVTDRLGGSLRPLRGAERAFWWSLMLAGVVAVFWVKSHDIAPDGEFPAAGSLTSRASVTLAPDGSASSVTDVSCQHEEPTLTSGFPRDAPQSSTVRWTDSQGRELAATATPVDDRVRYRVRLAETVYPGMRFSYVRTEEIPSAAVQEGDLWTYHYDQSYDRATNELTATVALPEGAELVSAKPWPDAQFRLGDRSMLRFAATRGADEPFRFTVRYRLAGPSN